MSNAELWEPGRPGVLKLPSGRLVRGRGLRRRQTPAEADLSPTTHPDPDFVAPDFVDPDFGLYLLGEPPPEFTWTARWLRWPDFRLPLDRADALDAITEAWTRAQHERVEVACAGGHGRTGTALACMAVLDGVEPRDAVAYVRTHYDAHAVETPWQRRYVRRFPARPSSA